MQVTSSNRPTHKRTGLNYTHKNKSNLTNGIMNLHEDMVTCINRDTEQIIKEDNETKDGKTSEEDKPHWTNSGPQVNRTTRDSSSTMTSTIETPSNEQH